MKLRKDMIIDILKDLIKIDTRTVIANETAAAVYLKEVCDQFKIDSEIIEPVKGKGSFIAHIPGWDKSKNELLLLSHLDTAEFGDLNKWKFHPLAATAYKERIVGRGAIDCKGLVSLWLSILINIRKNDLQPERGIVFAAVADEENGGEYGMEYLIGNNELIKNCEYVIGEGGGFPIKIGNTVYYTCQNAEKGSMSYQVEDVKIETGEIKETLVGNSLINVLKGLAVTQIYNMELMRFLVKQVLRNTQQKRIDLDSLLYDSYYWSKTEQGTLLNINCIPGTNAKVINSIIKNIGLDNRNLKLVSNVPPSHTTVNTNLYQIIANETARIFPNVKVIPYTTPGYSDNRFLRSSGRVVYGYFPLSLEDNLSGIHGYNEHISVQGLFNSYKLINGIISKFANTTQRF